MSFLKKVFGGKKKSTVPNTAESARNIQETEELLEKKQIFLEEQIEHEMEIAKKNASTNKRIAMQALKRKKRLEQQLDHVLSTIVQLETQRTTLEQSDMNAHVLSTMKDANKSLKKANKHMNIDNVQNVIDDISEDLGKANEVTEAISNLLLDKFDEDELERELEELKQDTLNENLLYIPKKLPEVPSMQLPIVPQENPNDAKSKEDDDLDQLLQWAN